MADYVEEINETEANSSYQPRKKRLSFAVSLVDTERSNLYNPGSEGHYGSQNSRVWIN